MVMQRGHMANLTPPTQSAAARAVAQASPMAGPSGTPPLQKVEYLAHNIEEGVEQIALFNNIGEEGWVLCAIDHSTAWFVRPRRSGPPTPQAPEVDMGPTVEKN